MIIIYNRDYCAKRFENDRHFMALTEMEREMSLKSEQVSYDDIDDDGVFTHLRWS